MALPKLLKTKRGRHVCPGRTAVLKKEELAESSFVYLVWFTEGYWSNKFDLSQVGPVEEIDIYAWPTNSPNRPEGESGELKEIVEAILAIRPIERRAYLEFAVADPESPTTPPAITSVEISPSDNGWEIIYK